MATRLRKEFVKKIEQAAKKKKPTLTKVDIRGSLFAKRNYRVAIREAALRGVTCVILYRKVTTKRLKRFEVLPISYRYKQFKEGWRKALYIEDVRQKHQIKNFIMRHIQKVAITDRKMKSRWPIEIK
mgnify:CR=1 FL=1